MTALELDRKPLVCITVDVEWAADEVLADLVSLIEARGVRATFFCTHAGCALDGHERALHPNFRRNGHTVRAMRQQLGDGGFAELTDEQFFDGVLAATREFAPEARGSRSHALLCGSDVLARYGRAGLRYDSSYSAPLTDVPPFRVLGDVHEFSIYYMDHIDLEFDIASFDVARLGLERPGLKVFDFHPNIVYVNAREDADYERGKAYYKDAARLRADRRAGPGARALLEGLLDRVARDGIETMTLAELDAALRSDD